MNKACLKTGTVLLIIVFTAAIAKANIIAFDTFGSGNTYNIPGGAIEISERTVVAAQFTPNVSGDISQIDLALGYFPSAAAVSILLYGDVNGSPGLFTNYLGSVTPAQPNGSVVTLSNFVNVGSIVQGTTYWLVLQSNSPFDANADAVWLASFTPGVQDYGDSITQEFHPLDIPLSPAFRVTVFGQAVPPAVPEPGSAILLLAVALTSLLGLKRLPVSR